MRYLVSRCTAEALGPQEVAKTPGVTIVDSTDPERLVIEVDAARLPELKKRFPEYRIILASECCLS